MISARLSDEALKILDEQQDIKKLLAEVERLQGRLSTCKFCGQQIAEGAGGHTSRCYERMLNEIKEVVQQDRNALLDEVKRLQQKLQNLTGVVP
jgi:iron uptake system EfeUOB component EfeO/EfeM